MKIILNIEDDATIPNGKLVPLEFDYTHSPDYWEEKYKELKFKLQDLIFKENE